jgi:hypothetical protein
MKTDAVLRGCARPVLRCAALPHGADPRGVGAGCVGRYGWTRTVKIEQIDLTPAGSRHVLNSASSNFKAGAENETEEARRKRLDVKRGARKRAIDSFDSFDSVSEKVKAKKQQRKKQRQGAPAAAAAAAAPAVAAVQPQGQASALPLESAAALGPTEPDLETRRDWALRMCCTPTRDKVSATPTEQFSSRRRDNLSLLFGCEDN